MTKKKTTPNFERVPLLVVVKEGDKIKFRTTRNITNFELFGFLKTYIKFLEIDLARHMSEANYNTKKGDTMDEFDGF